MEYITNISRAQKLKEWETYFLKIPLTKLFASDLGVRVDSTITYRDNFGSSIGFQVTIHLVL